MGLWSWFKQACVGTSPTAEETTRQVVLPGGPNGRDRAAMDQALDAIAEGIKAGKYRNIVVMTGAGISTSAGIPDFRSRAGLYELSQIFPNLPSNFAVFDGNYFKADPRPFYYLVRKMMVKSRDNDKVDESASSATPQPATYRPTPTHRFLRLLNDKGVLLRVFTQNVDCMEHAARLSADRLVQVHGQMNDAACSLCGQRVSMAHIKEALLQTDPAAPVEGKAASSDINAARAAAEASPVPRCPYCKTGVPKPNVVLFNETIPKSFFLRSAMDIPRADLLLCIGSTFQVMPFAQLIDQVDLHCPRVLINREPVQHEDGPLFSAQKRFRFFDEGNYRDVFIADDADAAVARLVRALGWESDFSATENACGEVGIDAFIDMQRSLYSAPKPV